MSQNGMTRRDFLATAGAVAGSTLLPGHSALGEPGLFLPEADVAADYSITIATKPIELAPKRIMSVTTYNGQFPGPLLRFKEGQRVTVDVLNETDVPEQLHWHGQAIPSDVDGASEEGTPFIPPHGSRRISFVPRPQDFASTTRTSERGTISVEVNTAVSLGPRT
ncbi:MAG: Multicopper oxidase [Edaphobacter sp.]|nr:Multicopper oxidase [Edaphobacter sp.]